MGHRQGQGLCGPRPCSRRYHQRVPTLAGAPAASPIHVSNRWAPSASTGAAWTVARAASRALPLPQAAHCQRRGPGGHNGHGRAAGRDEPAGPTRHPRSCQRAPRRLRGERRAASGVAPCRPPHPLEAGLARRGCARAGCSTTRGSPRSLALARVHASQQATHCEQLGLFRLLSHRRVQAIAMSGVAREWWPCAGMV